MKLEELLHELRVNLLRDASDIAPGGEDVNLFSDATLMRYIKDAEFKFCRETWCIRDSTTKHVTQIILEEGVQLYSTHHRVIKVLSVRYEDDVYDLYRSSHESSQSLNHTDGFDIAATVTQQASNRPSKIWTDESSIDGGRTVVTINVYPTPSADVTGKKLYLRVVRQPLYDYDLEKLNVESQVPEDYQLGVLHWAAYKAYMNYDSEKGSADAVRMAQAQKNAFDEMVIKAKNELHNKRRGPVRFKYGRNGFAW